MNEFLQKCEAELVNGYAKKRHPFRYFSLATIADDKPRIRTVVLRKLLPDFSLLFYTDLRSSKVSQLKQNNQVSALFYNPKKLLQIRVDGKVSFETDEKILRSYWNNIPENSRKDYITKLKPGSSIHADTEIEYDAENPNFSAVKIKAHTIEYLQLQRPSHLRLLFTKDEGEWSMQNLVP